MALVLSVTACTRANSEFLGGGGSAGTGGGGTAGSGGGGAAGSGGGGGTAGSPDLATGGDAHDMASHPPDMASHDGVACGTTSCKNGEDCCINNQGEMCTDQQQCSGGQHPTLWACDGPEDCPGTVPGTHAECCANSSGSACDDSCALVSSTSAPMCHSVADCSATEGYTACCVIKLLPQYSLCSKTACPP